MVNAIIAFIFAVTGPIAIMLTVGEKTGLSQAELASWIFGTFCLNGLISCLVSSHYKQPMVFLWSIPGIVLVGASAGHLSFPEIVGAYLSCGALLLVLGVYGLFTKIEHRIPMPIVMGMVAAVLLKFGTAWVSALVEGPWIAAPMTIAFFAIAAMPLLARICLPMIATLIVGIAALIYLGEFKVPETMPLRFAQPVIFLPEFTLRAQLELVIPLAITVLFAQNGQGIALLRNAGRNPPVNVITAVCGYGSVLTAWFGGVSTCLTGPVNGILLSGDEPRGHYTGAVVMSLLCALFGLMAPFFTALFLATPAAFIATLGGIALLNVLKGSFTTAFAGPFAFGALVSFIVTLSNVTFLKHRRAILGDYRRCAGVAGHGTQRFCSARSQWLDACASATAGLHISFRAREAGASPLEGQETAGVPAHISIKPEPKVTGETRCQDGKRSEQREKME